MYKCWGSKGTTKFREREKNKKEKKNPVIPLKDTLEQASSPQHPIPNFGKWQQLCLNTSSNGEITQQLYF